MRLTGSRAYYRPSPPKMPPGLVELMEGLTKEVLKHNPSDIYGFCSGHMQQLLDKRDGPSPKKSLSLEEKIARAQGKVRRRAESRKQEYDKVFAVQQQNIDVTNTVVKTDLKLEVPKDSNVVVDKDNDEVAKNIVDTPTHQEQVLKDSGEMKISQDSKSIVSKPTEDVDNNTEYVVKVQEVETVNSKISEKHPSATEAESNQQNGSTIFNNSSSNMNPDDKNVHKDLIESNMYETSKLLNTATTSENENQDNNLIKSEKQSEIYLQKLETAEHESEKSLNDCGVDNGKVENITDLVELKQTVDKPDEIEKNVLEPFEVKTEDFKDNETVTTNDTQRLPPPEAPTHFVHTYDSNNLQHTEENVKQHQHTEYTQLSTPIDDVEQSNDVVNSLTDNNILRTDRHDDVQVDNVEDPLETNSEISQELIEKNTQGRCNDTKDLNITANSDQVRDQNEQPEKIISAANDTPRIDFSDVGVDSDIPTLVTDNLVNDKYEIRDLGIDTLQLKRITSLDNMFEDNEKKSNLEQNLTGDVLDHTDHKDTVESNEKVIDVKYETDLKTNDTSQDKMSTKMYEDNQNDNQGTHMDLETAAVTIQKVFRNFLFKSRGSTFEDTTNDEGNFIDEDNKNKEESNFVITNPLSTDRRAHGITRMDTVLQTVNEEKSLSLSTDDSSTLSSAATIIQAHVRGFLVRNKLNSNKTVSCTSVAVSNSNEPSYTSLEAVSDQSKNKNVLNIHIVPEGENYLSRDESLITSMELSLDSPPSSINLHPLGYDKSERRKLKREDAIQSISPPSNNSGKLSEDLDSVKELPASGQDITSQVLDDINKENNKSIPIENSLTTTGLDKNGTIDNRTPSPQNFLTKRESITKMNSDENDVVTPFVSTEDLTNSKLMHSGEFHEAVLPTRVSRSDTSVVSGE